MTALQFREKVSTLMWCRLVIRKKVLKICWNFLIFLILMLKDAYFILRDRGIAVNEVESNDRWVLATSLERLWLTFDFGYSRMYTQLLSKYIYLCLVYVISAIYSSHTPHAPILTISKCLVPNCGFGDHSLNTGWFCLIIYRLHRPPTQNKSVPLKPMHTGVYNNRLYSPNISTGCLITKHITCPGSGITYDPPQV